MNHENLAATGDAPAPPSLKNFGLTFTGFFILVAFLPLLRGGSARLWALGVALVFLVLTYAWPAALKPLNAVWFRIGMLLHRIVNPIVLGVLFFAVFTPMAFIMRLAGRNTFAAGKDAKVASYWIARTPPGPANDSCRHQF